MGPLLAFVRPTERVQRILIWEGCVVDPVGATLGALVFAAVAAGKRPGIVRGVGEFATGLLVGAAGAAVGLAVLVYVLRRMDLGEVLGATSQVAVTVAVAAGCDVVRDDTGLIAAILLGVAVGNLRGFDLPARRPFLESLVHLVLGLLFIAISATVTPASLRSVLVPGLALAAVLVLLVRPLVAAISTARTELGARERAFVGWIAPRGIVAAATASTFGSALATDGEPGASRILPTTFLVVVVTVTVYGLTAAPAARLLHVTRPARTRPLLVGGDPWVVDLGLALRQSGLQPLVWPRTPAQRDRAGAAGLELASGELLAAATGRGAELEGITAVLLLTADDDVNALAALLLDDAVDGPVYRIAPSSDGAGIIAAPLDGQVIFDAGLTPAELDRRYAVGERIRTVPAARRPPDAVSLLLVRADGRLAPVTPAGPPPAEPGDAVVVLAPAAR